MSETDNNFEESKDKEPTKKKTRSRAPKTSPEKQSSQTGNPHPLSAHRYRSVFKDQDQLDDEASTMDLLKVVKGAKRHVWVMLFCAVLFAAAAFGGGLYLSKTYRAEAFVLYKSESAKELSESYVLNRFSLPTVVAMMQLPSHLKAVKSILGLDWEVEDLQEIVDVSLPSGRSDLIKISSKYRDSSLVVDIVNTLANVVVKQSEDTNRRQLQAAFDYFKEQREVAQGKLARVTQLIAEFKTTNPHFEMESGSSTLVAEAATAEAQYEQSVISYNSLLVEYENLKREAARVPDHIVQYAYEDNPLKDRIAKTEMELLEARTRYAPDNPKIKILESTLEELRKMVSDASFSDAKGKVYRKNPLKEELNIELMRFQGKLRSAQKVKEDMSDTLSLAERELKDLPKEQMKFARMLQKRESTQQEIKTLEEALRSAEQMMSIGTGDIELYQMADSAKSIVSKWDDFIDFLPLIGFAGGLFFGLMVAMVMEATDNRICTPKQIELVYNPECLQLVPEMGRLSKKGDPEDKTLFYIRTLYDHLKHLNQQQTIQSVCFTSAKAGEGKSTVGTFFAQYAGKRLDQKAIIIDFDATSNLYLGENGTYENTLDEYLNGDKTISQIIKKPDGKEFDYIKVNENSDLKELIQSDRMNKLMKYVKDHYDLVVFEAPSVIESDYVADVAKLSEMVVFVIGSSKVKKAYVDTALHELESNGIRLTGFVLNRVLPLYISDLRVLAERKRNRFKLWKGIFSTKKKQA